MLSTDLLPEPAIVLDANGHVTSANGPADRCFGGPVKGRSLAELVSKPEDLLGPLAAAADGEVWRAELEGLRADGASFALDASGRVLEEGPPRLAIVLMRDVTELRRLAERDPLTDVYNRRAFEEALAERLRHGARYAPPGALLVFDLDGFKAVNDRLGHAACDQVLTDVARAVETRVRETDLLARLDGDEFAVIIPHATGMEAQIVGRAIVELIRSLPHGITASVGIAPFAEGRSEPAPVLAAADAALQEVKQAGGDAFALREPS